MAVRKRALSLLVRLNMRRPKYYSVFSACLCVLCVSAVQSNSKPQRRREGAETFSNWVGMLARSVTTHVLFGVLLVVFGPIAQSQSIAPQIFKVDPPSWWTRSSANPIRLLIRGRNLQDSQVQVSAIDVRIVGAPKVNERGTYAFVDVSIASNAKAGKHELKLRTSYGVAQASFEVLPALNRQNRFQGFSPSDVFI